MAIAVERATPARSKFRIAVRRKSWGIRPTRPARLVAPVQAERSAVVSLVAVYKSLGGGWSPGAPDPSAGQIEGGRP